MDEDTARLLEALAAPRAGNKSFVGREAVRRMAQQEGFEEYLDWLEAKPKVRATMERALADERDGNTVAHEDVLKKLAKIRRKVRRIRWTNEAVGALRTTEPRRGVRVIR